jgi:hypothetical protein
MTIMVFAVVATNSLTGYVCLVCLATVIATARETCWRVPDGFR